jgi:tRNA dimethylallyltransferase
VNAPVSKVEGPPILAILGPTATGKSALGIELALRRGGEIISCDSTAVYRGFDIGTDKVPHAERRGIPHHLIDVVEPTDEYTAARYVRDTVAVIEQIYGRGRWPIIVGGTGLYYRALVRGLFPGPGATRRCGAVSNGLRNAAASSFCTACWRGSTRLLPTGFSRAIASA